MSRKLKIFWIKILATISLFLYIPCVVSYRNQAWGDKKSVRTIWKELLIMIWRDYAYLTVNEWGIKQFIWDYFVERVHLKTSALEDYVSDVTGVLIMKLSSSLALKRIQTLDNKDSFWNFMKKHNFPLTRRLGHLHKSGNSVVWLQDGEEPSTLETLFHAHGAVFVKPADATQGANCALIEPSEKSGYLRANHVEMRMNDFFADMQSDLLIEEVVKQHEALAALHPQSLNTVRMVTMKKENGEMYLEQAIQRVGVGDMRVDNFSKGGVAISVTDDGKLISFGRRKDFSLPNFVKHPDTGIKFEGYTIPYFKQAVDMVLRAHQLNKGLNGVGWDVAITENGPLIVEANPFFDFDIMQTTTRGYKKILWQRYLHLAKKYAVYSDVLL